MVNPGFIRTDQANVDQHQGVTTMAFEAPPAEGRQCISCGDIKPLNFFGLDQQEGRNCESKRCQQAITQNANDSVEEDLIKTSLNKHMHQCSIDIHGLLHRWRCKEVSWARFFQQQSGRSNYLANASLHFVLKRAFQNQGFTATGLMTNHR